MNTLQQLSKFSRICVDTADIHEIRRCAAQDATTNPTLVLKALKSRAEKGLDKQSLFDAIDYALKKRRSEAEYETQPETHDDEEPSKETLNLIADKLCVDLGCDVLSVVPGVVSTEVDARLSFDKETTVRRARRLISLYEEQHEGSRDRVLIKIAATWQGIQAARELEAEGIHCNITLIFSLAQARAAAAVGATLVSPFVGRVSDWHKAKGEQFEADQDPGVLLVKRVYNTFKSQNVGTVVMGASFRSTRQILELAGCDRLTISPSLCAELANGSEAVERKLSPERAEAEAKQLEALPPISEAEFFWQLNEDAMASEKLSEGIRLFANDQIALEKLLSEAMKQRRNQPNESAPDAKAKAWQGEATAQPASKAAEGQASSAKSDRSSLYPLLPPALEPLVSPPRADAETEASASIPLSRVAVAKEDDAQLQHGPLHPKAAEPDTTVDTEVSELRADERARRANLRAGVGDPTHSQGTYIT